MHLGRLIKLIGQSNKYLATNHASAPEPPA